MLGVLLFVAFQLWKLSVAHIFWMFLDDDMSEFKDMFAYRKDKTKC